MSRSTHQLIYTVNATIGDAKLVDEYVAWLIEGHMQAVVAGGASSAEVSRIDPIDSLGSWQISTRYRFADPATLATYERGPAIALRAEGLQRFGPLSQSPITFSRSVGTLIASL